MLTVIVSTQLGKYAGGVEHDEGIAGVRYGKEAFCREGKTRGDDVVKACGVCIFVTNVSSCRCYGVTNRASLDEKYSIVEYNCER